MSNFYRVEYQGETFCWECENETWFDVQEVPVAPDGELADALRACFIEQHATKECNAARKQNQINSVFSILEQCVNMGASLKDLSSFVDWSVTQQLNFDKAAQAQLSNMPEQARTFLNCPILRDQFFASKDCSTDRSFQAISLLGQEPFGHFDLSDFLEQQGIQTVIADWDTECVVMGREDWNREDLDEIIDGARGQQLRFYSQEMLLSVLAGQPDPFDLEDKNSELAFQAFSKGHPGLELVAQGWEGWVKARVPQYGIRGTARDFDASGWVQESPLKKKGYTVGVDGLPESVRRDILRRAYKGRLDFVRDRAYMREWGHPNTPDRLHRIAKHLAGRINNAAGQEAIADWTADLRWLKQEFYHGVNSFDWPAATP